MCKGISYFILNIGKKLTTLQYFFESRRFGGPVALVGQFSILF